MGDEQASDLRGNRLRSNPRLRLLAFDQLDADHRRALEPLRRDPDFYGVLMPPRGSALPVRAVSRDLALLLLTLHAPANLPHLLTAVFGSTAEHEVRRLVSDGILEIERDGSFLSGPRAIAGTVELAGDTSLGAQLSADAIRYGASLRGLSIAAIANRMYAYNRVPCTPQRQQQFADTECTLSYLFGDSGTSERTAARWVLDMSDRWWLVWRTFGTATRLPYKLYISPTLDALPAAFRLAVDALARTKCTRFKVGLTVYGLLRPDKFVAYFPDLETLHSAAELICDSMGGLPVQGVPFSGMIHSAGLVSWGMDPPLSAQALTPQSWRQWVAERLAVYIVEASEAGAADATEFALSRIALDGIDPATWTPSLAIWTGGVRERGPDA